MPRQLLHNLNTTYPNVFNIPKLENELLVIYSCDVKNKLEPLELFDFIFCNSLEEVYSEATKLLKVTFTIPLTTASSERSMSTLKRIKTYLRNTMSNERLTSLATISIEKDTVANYLKYPKFKDNVIDHFAANKKRRIDLIYKSI